MKEKLKKFKTITQNLLPHETGYLVSRINSQDTEKSEILNRVNQNARNIKEFTPYDTSIDKRKYSSLLKWIENELNKIDVDKGLEWISEIQQNILIDNISPAQELNAIKSLKKYNATSYYFMKYYDMLIEYRHYLLIRMRYNDYKKVNDYLEKFKFDFQRSKLINDQMHQATFDIIGKYNDDRTEGIQWKGWLRECFEDKNLDGLNRYMALVRLSFICLQHNLLQELEGYFQTSESIFNNGKNYSKRLLLNYYDNMLVLYDKKGEYDKAIYYGYLSIKDINQDSIIYVNNLVNVLIKNRQFAEALRLIENTNINKKVSKNFHSVVGFISNHIRCLSKMDRSKEAIVKGRIFLDAYQSQIIHFRWHRFFAAYLGALLVEEKYVQIIKLIQKYSLVEKEEESSVKNNSTGIISVYSVISRYRENKMTRDSFVKFYSNLKSFIKSDSVKFDKELIALLDELASTTQ